MSLSWDRRCLATLEQQHTRDSQGKLLLNQNQQPLNNNTQQKKS